MKKYSNIQKITILSFMIVPLLSSFISTIHIVEFFGLGNNYWMAVLLAMSFEIGSIASALSITVLDKIKKWVTFSIFFILVFFQCIGNVYFSFNYISELSKTNPDILKNALEFFGYFWEIEYVDFKIYLSALVGLPIPLISIAFLKSVVDYLSKINEDIIPEKIEEVQEKIESEDLPQKKEVGIDTSKIIFTNGDSLEVEQKDTNEETLEAIKNKMVSDPNFKDELNRMFITTTGKPLL